MFGKYRWIIAGIIFFSNTLAVGSRIEDIADIKGAQTNPLLGYGLVVGLNGTGDKSGTAAKVRAEAALLKRFNIEVSEQDVESKNVAYVMVTINLKPFVREGQKVTVNVSSMGNAGSLANGILLPTTLIYPYNGEVYAIASGPLSTGGGQGRGSPTSATATAVVEKAIPVNFIQENTVTFLLKRPNFYNANSMVEAINLTMRGKKIARALDASAVEVQIPSLFRKEPVGFISKIQQLELITTDAVAKVVINEKTGTVVINRHVRIAPFAISHGDLMLTVGAAAPQPGVQRKTLLEVPEGAELESIVKGLNKLGAAPEDLIAIMKELKNVGVLEAELEIR